MAATAVERFGRIDCLINNAALRREKAFDQMTLAEWREIMGVILEGAFNCAKACLPYLRRSGAGAIVNIGGLSAHTGARRTAPTWSPPRPGLSASRAGSPMILQPTT